MTLCIELGVSLCSGFFIFHRVCESLYKLINVNWFECVVFVVRTFGTLRVSWQLSDGIRQCVIGSILMVSFV